jgi:hypothetical protein
MKMGTKNDGHRSIDGSARGRPVSSVTRRSLLGMLAAGGARGAVCLTNFDPNPARVEFQKFVDRRISFAPLSGKPAWVGNRSADLETGNPVIQSRPVDDAPPPHCSILRYIGAIRIRNAGIATLKGVLQDYRNYPSIYGDAIPRVDRVSGSDPRFDTQMVLHQTHMLDSFAFSVRAINEFSESAGALVVKSTLVEMRESESGNPQKEDLMPFGRDHGILWGLTTVWRARQVGADVYAEYEAASLARSLDEIRCFLVGQFFIRKEVAKSAEDTIRQTLVGTRDACEKRRK